MTAEVDNPFATAPHAPAIPPRPCHAFPDFEPSEPSSSGRPPSLHRADAARFTDRFHDIGQHYRLGRELGHGGGGLVRVCEDLTSGEEVAACKTILKDSLKSSSSVEELRVEISAMQRVAGSSDGIVELKGVFEDAAAVHLVMELCEGGDLFEFLTAKGRLDEPLAADLICQLLQAIIVCHSNGLLHRDIKPENLLLTRKPPAPRCSSHSCDPSHPLPAKPPTASPSSPSASPPLTSSPSASSTTALPCPSSPSDPLPSLRLKLADFGLCIELGFSGQKAVGVYGSTVYMAPEVVARGPYGFAVDVWGAGVVMHTMLSGFLPFWGATEGELHKQILNDDLDFQEEPWPSISEEAKSLLRRMLCKEPQRRISPQEAASHPWILKHCPEASRKLQKFSIAGRDSSGKVEGGAMANDAKGGVNERKVAMGGGILSSLVGQSRSLPKSQKGFKVSSEEIEIARDESEAKAGGFSGEARRTGQSPLSSSRGFFVQSWKKGQVQGQITPEHPFVATNNLSPRLPPRAIPLTSSPRTSSSSIESPSPSPPCQPASCFAPSGTAFLFPFLSPKKKKKSFQPPPAAAAENNFSRRAEQQEEAKSVEQSFTPEAQSGKARRAFQLSPLKWSSPSSKKGSEGSYASHSTASNPRPQRGDVDPEMRADPNSCPAPESSAREGPPALDLSSLSAADESFRRQPLSSDRRNQPAEGSRKVGSFSAEGKRPSMRRLSFNETREAWEGKGSSPWSVSQSPFNRSSGRDSGNVPSTPSNASLTRGRSFNLWGNGQNGKNVKPLNFADGKDAGGEPLERELVTCVWRGFGKQ